MSTDNYFVGRYESIDGKTTRRKKDNIVLHVVLFGATFLTTSIAGAQWAGKAALDITEWQYGFLYAFLVLTFLATHEFGHYIAARLHKVDATLPYFIPFYIPLLHFSFFGTMGAVIKTRNPIPSTKALFDIGIAGPLAGFVVSIAWLIIGFATLPGKDFLLSIHPNYGQPNPEGTMIMYFGTNLVFSWLASWVPASGAFIPPMSEVYHYPFLCAGWFGLFVTSLNLMPIGQLDGGHITYAMFGKKQRVISRVVWWCILVIGLGEALSTLNQHISEPSPNGIYEFFRGILAPGLGAVIGVLPWLFIGWSGYLFWAIFTRIFVKLDHPPLLFERPLDPLRMAIGYVALVVFVLTFTYQGIWITAVEGANVVQHFIGFH